MSDRPPDDPEILGYLKVSEWQRTIRTAIICATVSVCVGCICWAIVKIFDQPPWVTAIVVIGAGLTAPSGVLWAFVTAYRSHLRRTTDRTKELEEKLDPARSSSGLQEDGTTKDGF